MPIGVYKHIPHSGTFKKGHKFLGDLSKPNYFKKGYKHTEAWKKNQREIAKERVKLGIHNFQLMTGEKNHNWKDGISKEKGYHTFHSKRRRARRIGNGGSHTLAQWEELKMQYGYMCLCCKKCEPEIKLTEDHIIPVSKGGNDNIENIQPLCNRCNSSKCNKIISYFLTEQFIK
jgi:hypothetical protein